MVTYACTKVTKVIITVLCFFLRDFANFIKIKKVKCGESVC